MPFVKIKPQRGIRPLLFSEGADYARLTKSFLKFSEDFWKDQLQECEYLSLYYSDEKRTIGIEPCASKEEGWKVYHKRGAKKEPPSIFWESFLRQTKLVVEKGTSCKLEKEGRLWTLNLNSLFGKK